MIEVVEGHASKKQTLSWKGRANMAAFYLCHVVCLAAFWMEFRWSALALCFFLFLIRMFAITAGYHRLFSHRAFKTNRVVQFVLAWVGCSSAQKGPLWWAAHHRAHHLNADGPIDIHSPTREGFLWSHMGWWLSDKYDATDEKRIPDLMKFPELVWLNKYFLIPPVVLALVCLGLDGARGLIWGFFISTVVLWHTTFLINSAAHVFGKRRFKTNDTSRNNFILAILTLGEGWHNNHHYYPASTNQGFYWWEIDITFYGLWLMEKMGLIDNIRKPPDHVLALGRKQQTTQELLH
jgi:stearoyl-CoA desaturase (Delta-9 desaturase)